MDTRMVDVAIGLALVFALGGLLATAWQEGWASYRNQRGKNLMKAIESLLGDDADFARTLMQEPLLKSMSMTRKNGSQRDPSWITADVFVTALLGYLCRTYVGTGTRPATPLELVAHLEAKAAGNAAFVTSLKTLLPGSENDWTAYQARLCAWFNAVGDRSTGWFKRGSQYQLFYAGLALAFVLNINPIVIGLALWNDAGLRKNAVAQAELALRTYQAETTASVAGKPMVVVTPAPAPSPSGNSKVQPAQVAPLTPAAPHSTAPTATMRAVDWQVAQLAANMHYAADQLGHGPVDGATQHTLQAYVQASELLPVIQKERKSNPATDDGRTARQATDQLLAALQAALDAEPGVASPAKEQAPAQLKTLIDAIAKERLERESEAAKTKSDATDPCDRSDDANAKQLCRDYEGLKVLDSIGIPLGWGEEVWPPRVFPLRTKAPGGGGGVGSKGSAGAAPSPASSSSASDRSDKLRQLAGDSGLVNTGLNYGVGLLGWLITALAVTLGAPFWFDTLSKLVNLRGAGGRPDAESSKAATENPKSGSGALATPSAPAAFDAAADRSSTHDATDDAMSDAERQLKDDEIVRIQRRLGMPASALSSRLDLTTRDAIAQWQKRTSANPDGILTGQQISTLLAVNFGSDDDGYFG